MTWSLIGAIGGLVLAAADWILLGMLGQRVDREDTKRALKITALLQFILLPVIGWFLVPLIAGE